MNLIRLANMNLSSVMKRVLDSVYGTMVRDKDAVNTLCLLLKWQVIIRKKASPY